MPTALVTGAAGFIGFFAAQRLFGLVTVLSRSFDLVSCHKGEQKWQTDTAKNSSVMRYALL